MAWRDAAECAAAPRRPAVKTARHGQQGPKRGSQHLEARGEADCIRLTAPKPPHRFHGRQRRTRRLEDELPRHRLRAPQYPEYETADGMGPGGGALGQGGKRDEQRHDAPQRPIVPYCRMHVHPAALRSPAGIVLQVFGSVDGIEQEIAQVVDPAGSGHGFCPPIGGHKSDVAGIADGTDNIGWPSGFRGLQLSYVDVSKKAAEALPGGLRGDLSVPA